MKKIPEDYFLDIDDDMLDYLEKEGKECFNSIEQSISKNKENADKILSILILGIGSSFLLLTQKGNFDLFFVLLLSFSLLWSAAAAMLIMFCTIPKRKALLCSAPSCNYTEPYKKVEKDKALGLMRRYNLISMEMTISEYLLYNSKLSKWLTRVMYTTVITPLISLLVSIIFYCYLL